MNNRERIHAILNYEDYDCLPIVHFSGYWPGTLRKWVLEGHITCQEAANYSENSAADLSILARLGFDFNWYAEGIGVNSALVPPFEERVIEERADGTRIKMNKDGVTILEKYEIDSIPTEIDHLLKTREEWETHYLPRLRFSWERTQVNQQKLATFNQGNGDSPVPLWCGSLYGYLRDWVGLVNLAYLQADDPVLFDEMICTLGELTVECMKALLTNLPPDFTPDYGIFWEDICYRSGPLVNPRLFRKKIGPYYRQVTDLLHARGVTLVSLDCDGKIDELLPIWLENGVNVMFPMEVGVWNASIKPWRDKYGREIRGVGGVDKRVFALDYAAVEAEIERIKPLVDLGGYIPCPDHGIPADSKWENVQYYCDRMRKTFGG